PFHARRRDGGLANDRRRLFAGLPSHASLVLQFINTHTFAARDFCARRGASDEHTPQRSVSSEQQSLAQKDLPPGGLRRIWLGALLLLAHRPLAGMLPRRA